MAGRVGIAPERGASTIAYVGLGVFATGAVLGLNQAGYVDRVVATATAGMCGALRLPDCGRPPADSPPGIGPGTGARPAGNGWSGVGRRPDDVPHMPVPLFAGGAAVFAVFWWDVPRRLRNRLRPRTPAARHRARGNARAAAAAPEPVVPEAMPGPEVAIAAIDPGIAGKGMRVGVRGCEVTLRPGGRGSVRLDKTLARTGDREFAAAGRTVRRCLQDPAFVAALIEETGRAAAYLDGNPQLAGAAARRAELTSLAGALEGLGHGPSD